MKESERQIEILTHINAYTNIPIHMAINRMSRAARVRDSLSQSLPGESRQATDAMRDRTRNRRSLQSQLSQTSDQPKLGGEVTLDIWTVGDDQTGEGSDGGQTSDGGRKRASQ